MDAFPGNIWQSGENGRIRYLIWYNLYKISLGIFLIVSLFPASAQDTCIQTPSNPLRQITVLTMIDFFTTFTGIAYLNGQTACEKNNLHLYYNLTINNKIKSGQFSLTTYYFTEFGIRSFADSITSITEDQYCFKNSLSYQFGESNFALNIATNSKSQYYRHYEYRPDSAGQQVKFIYTSYLSPGYKNFSGGLKFEVNKHFTLELGLVNGKTTLIKNQEIFNSRESEKLYGLEKGTTRKSEYGLNLVITVTPTKVFKNLYFENFSQFNISKSGFHHLRNSRADVNHAFHYIFLKHFRLTLRTLCQYDLAVGPKVKVVNNLSIGFYLNNRF
ncbi:MAG: hypothetical protein AB9834_05840 [Lentimicrobium sp.]